MNAEEIANVVSSEPFRPFEVRVRGGERIVVSRPLRALVTQQQLFLGVAESAKTGLSNQLRRVSISDVVSIRRINGAASKRRK